MTIAIAPPAKHSAYTSGALALVLAVGAILGALALEHIGGVKPCHLCLEQRYAYYAGAPLLFAALVLLSAGQRRAAALLFALPALAFLANASLGAYHAGVEWHFWPGPTSCTGAEALTTSAGGLLEALATTHVVRCDEAAFRVFGVSLAGWNVAASLLIAALAARAALRSTRI
jgi:disulfide bond formation protein DsbB